MPVAETANVCGAAEDQPQKPGAELLPFSYITGLPWGKPQAGAPQGKRGSPQHTLPKTLNW